MSLSTLTQANFEIKKSTDDQYMLCVKKPGISVVLFYASEHQESSQFLGTFVSALQRIQGCNFYLVDLRAPANKAIITRSREANCRNRIDTIPLVMAFVNSYPIAAHSIQGSQEHDGQNFLNFITRIVSKPAMEAGRDLQLAPSVCTGKPSDKQASQPPKNTELVCEKGVCTYKPCAGGKCSEKIKETYKNYAGLPYNLVCSKNKCYLRIDGTCPADSTVKMSNQNPNGPKNYFIINTANVPQRQQQRVPTTFL